MNRSVDNFLEFNRLCCCAVKEIAGIHEYNEAEKLLQHIKEKLSVPNCAVVIFTHTGSREIGHRLAELIHKKKLGSVYVNPQIINPNTGNRVTMFSWHIDQKKWQAFK